MALYFFVWREEERRAGRRMYIEAGYIFALDFDIDRRHYVFSPSFFFSFYFFISFSFAFLHFFFVLRESERLRRLFKMTVWCSYRIHRRGSA